MKKFLNQLNDQTVAKARAKARRRGFNAIKTSLLENPLLKKYLPRQATIRWSALRFSALRFSTKNILQYSGVVVAFLVTGIFVNEPLRNDLLQQLSLRDEYANLDDYDINQPGEAGMRPVIFNNPVAFQKNVRYGLIEPSVMQHLVPSIAPLANQIPLDKVDPLAHDTHLLDSVANQHKVAQLMADKYKVDLDILKNYISHAVIVGKEAKIDPLLIVAVMAIESNFNAMVQSPVGAQGLMQVMTNIHASKFAPYGGAQAAFKPEANIRVGTYILKYFIAQAGSLQGGLKHYVGGALSTDGGYTDKVLRERTLLLSLLGGDSKPTNEGEAAQANKSTPSSVQSALRSLGFTLSDS